MSRRASYNFAFLDEGSKREIRRAVLKGIAIPGYQVPFASREMPVARGWGTGGIQITLSIVGGDDILKVIDQGSDESVNAVSIKRLVVDTTGVATTDVTSEATILQTRHRVPEAPLGPEQVLVLQVPMPEPLRFVEPSEHATKRLHAEREYSGAYLALFEEIMKHGSVSTGADHPVTVHARYVMSPSPIPRFDNPKLHRSKALMLFGAGREKKIYAIPPYTDVASLDFEDHPFRIEDQSGRNCRICRATGVFMDERLDRATGAVSYQCNDSSYCAARSRAREGLSDPREAP